jgi:hypothetical protein
VSVTANARNSPLAASYAETQKPSSCASDVDTRPAMLPRAPPGARRFPFSVTPGAGRAKAAVPTIVKTTTETIAPIRRIAAPSGRNADPIEGRFVGDGTPRGSDQPHSNVVRAVRYRLAPWDRRPTLDEARS